MPSINIGGEDIVLSGEQMRALQDVAEQATETKRSKGDVVLEAQGINQHFTIKVGAKTYPADTGDLESISTQITRSKDK